MCFLSLSLCLFVIRCSLFGHQLVHWEKRQWLKMRAGEEKHRDMNVIARLVSINRMQQQWLSEPNSELHSFSRRFVILPWRRREAFRSLSTALCIAKKLLLPKIRATNPKANLLNFRLKHPDHQGRQIHKLEIFEKFKASQKVTYN